MEDPFMNDLFVDEVNENIENKKPWKIIVADDEDAIHAMTNLVLEDFSFESRAVQIFNAYSSEEAIEIFKREDDIALVFLDIIMENESAGLDVISYIRDIAKNDATRIVIRTGQPGSAPESKIVLEYDINDYKAKSELTYQKLVISTISALRSYRDIMALHKARSEAEEATKAKARFLANMSHELRTPMNGIIGVAQLLENTSLTNEQETYVQILNEASSRLLNTINEILDLSKYEMGGSILRNRPINLKKMLKGIMNVFLPEIQKKHITMDLIVDDTVPLTIVSDEDKLKHILINLLGNAVKFTDFGSVLLMVEGRKLSGTDKIEMIMRIKDTGIGIPKDQQMRIFDSFTQVDNSTSRKYEGTGLGLAITKSLVNLLDGEIFLESEVGKGSTFYFSFICKYESSSFDEKILSNEKVDKVEDMNILLAEDDIINQRVIASLLESMNWKVTIVDNGEKALKSVRDNFYDVVLMDISMPGMDGFQAVSHIRMLKDKDTVPIIALTAHVGENFAKACRESGMDGYLSKPVDAKKLFNTLSGIVSKRRKGFDSENLPPDIYKKVVDYFVETDYKENLINEIMEAVSNKDRESIAKLVHKAKGSLANLAVEEITENIISIERELYNLSFDQIKTKIVGLDSLLNEWKIKLKDIN